MRDESADVIMTSRLRADPSSADEASTGIIGTRPRCEDLVITSADTSLKEHTPTA